MSNSLSIHQIAMDMLEKTSRTFFIPINHLSPGLREVVTASYLCMRAIDEIEDHPQLPSVIKIELLHSIQKLLQKPIRDSEWNSFFDAYRTILPRVTLQLGDWLSLCPPDVEMLVRKATASMAEGMANWVERKWDILTEADLDDYTYYVAGLVGVMLSDLWEWSESIETDRDLAIAFGRGLQAVNIIRNRQEDLNRGVDFFPTGWDLADMFRYARQHLASAETYIQSITHEPIVNFCRIPLALAHGTLEAIESGSQKLSRSMVVDIVKTVTSVSGKIIPN